MMMMMMTKIVKMQKMITILAIMIIIMIMCISKVKYGIARSPMVVFETEMAVREKYIN